MTARPEPVITPPEETRSGLWELRLPSGGCVMFDDPGFVLCALAPDTLDDPEE